MHNINQHMCKRNAMTKSSTYRAGFQLKQDTARMRPLTEGKWRRGKAQIDTSIIGNIRQTLGDEEGVLGVEMHHLLRWGRSARSEASGRAGCLLLLELLLCAVHAEVWVVLLLRLTCELRSLHSVIGGSGVGIRGGVRCSRRAVAGHRCVVWLGLGRFQVSGFLFSFL